MNVVDDLTVWQKLLLMGGGLLLLVGVVLVAKSFLVDETKVEILEASPEVLSAAVEKKPVVVDVAGAVVSPGVYQLEGDSRVGAALTSAGGLSASADREWVARNVNLAGRLVDGAKIYIPPVGEMAGDIIVNSNRGTGMVNINTATAGELDTLPGVGPATASKIISNRPYQSIEELVSKKAVVQSVFEKIKDRISVY